MHTLALLIIDSKTFGSEISLSFLLIHYFAAALPWHFLYLRPLPHGQGSFLLGLKTTLDTLSEAVYFMMFAGARPCLSSLVINLIGPSMCLKNSL